MTNPVETMNEAAAKIRELRQENERLGIDMRAWKILAESAKIDIERLNGVIERSKQAYKAWEAVAREKAAEIERLRNHLDRHHGGQSGCAVCGLDQ